MTNAARDTKFVGHRAALRLRLGGVGYYPRGNFLHIDTGDIRSW